MNLTVESQEIPLRIDLYIFEQLKDQIISRSKVQSLIKSGDILLNGEPAKKNAKVKTGDRIEINLREQVETKIIPENIPINIVYEDDDLIVVNKARGMVVHPAISNYTGTLVNAVLYHVNNKAEAKAFFAKNMNTEHAKVRPGIVHRIDKETTGLLMIAKNDYAHYFLSEQLKDRTVNRKYLALVHGGFKDDEGRVDAPIRRHKKDRLKMAVDLTGKRAVTNYQVLERLGKYTLLELKLDTGRTHQIRVHMKHIKHPVVGDKVYGAKNCKYKHIGQLLHAKTLGFIHPSTKEYMEFECDLPDDFNAVLQSLLL